MLLTALVVFCKAGAKMFRHRFIHLLMYAAENHCHSSMCKCSTRWWWVLAVPWPGSVRVPAAHLPHAGERMGQSDRAGTCGCPCPAVTAVPQLGHG